MCIRDRVYHERNYDTDSLPFFREFFLCKKQNIRKRQEDFMSYTLESKTGKYIDTPLTNFPVSEDVWNRMMDVTSSLMPLVTQYNEYFLSLLQI